MGQERQGFVCLNYNQAKQIVNMFGGEDSEVTVEYLQDGPEGTGLYAHYTEYPEEGIGLLDPALDVECEPWKGKPSQFFAQPLEAVTYNCYALYDVEPPCTINLPAFGPNTVMLAQPIILEPMRSILEKMGET